MIFIGDISTTINEEALSRWAEILPGCATFLENFFGTCTPFPPEVNYLNYRIDLGLYAPTNKCIRQNERRLMKAFYEITGTTERDMKQKAWEYELGGRQR